MWYWLSRQDRSMRRPVLARHLHFLRLSRKLFHRILEEYPDPAFMLHGRIVDDLQAMVSRIEALAPRFAS